MGKPFFAGRSTKVAFGGCRKRNAVLRGRNRINCAHQTDAIQAERDPQVQLIGMITSYKHPTAGEVKVVAPTVKLSETPAAIERPAPLVGEHTREILAEYGYGAAEIDDVLTRGIGGEPKRACPLKPFGEGRANGLPQCRYVFIRNR
nr:CoA transferase [Mesorhizobium silamurunense]